MYKDVIFKNACRHCTHVLQQIILCKMTLKNIHKNTKFKAKTKNYVQRTKNINAACCTEISSKRTDLNDNKICKNVNFPVICTSKQYCCDSTQQHARCQEISHIYSLSNMTPAFTSTCKLHAALMMHIFPLYIDTAYQ